jgi:predicted nuclease of predicted toxin-antitoxin system
VRWLADENFNNDILRAVSRRNPAVDIVRLQDVGPMADDDASVLAWAAAENRVLLTHDVSTVTGHAYRRVIKGECSRDREWEGQVRDLPLR